MTGPFETASDAARCSAYNTDGRDAGRRMTESNREQLAAALAGIELGAFDATIIEWLAAFEPSTVTVICGLIARARQAGQG